MPRPAVMRFIAPAEGDPADTDYLLDEWPEGLLAHAANPTIPVFIVSAIAAHPLASRGAGDQNSIRLHMCLSVRGVKLDVSAV
jgi:hypothetical protein